MGSPGMDELRWLQPVRPGDTLYVKAKILDTRPSRSRLDRGRAVIAYENHQPKQRNSHVVQNKPIFCKNGPKCRANLHFLSLNVCEG